MTWDAKVEKWAYWCLLLLGLGSCLSEPFTRNCTRAVLFFLLVYCLYRPRSLELLIPYKKMLAAVGAIALVMACSAFYGGKFYETITSRFFWYNYNMLLIPAAIIFIREKCQVDRIILMALCSLFIVDCYIFWQSVHGVLRPMSFLGPPVMLTAMLYVILLPINAVILFRPDIFPEHRRLYWGLFIVSLFGFFLNNTRGAWLGMFIVFIFMGFYYVRDWKRLLAIAGVCGLLLGGIFYIAPRQIGIGRIANIGTAHDQSERERFLLWQSSIQMFKDHPVFGVGMGNYTKLYQTKYISPKAREPHLIHAHSNFFQFLGEEGAIGAFVYCASFGYILYWSWRRKCNAHGMMIFVSTLCFVLFGMTDYFWGEYTGLRVYWLMLGLCMYGVEECQSLW